MRETGSEKDLETQIREAFAADDPEAAWYLDRAGERVLRVSRGATSDPDVTAEEVEDDDARYVEIPAVTESELHAWMEDFVDGYADAKVAALLDERHGANERFVERLAKADPVAFAAWKAFHAERIDAAIAAWRAATEAEPG
jgi:hypothetical protein